MDIDQDFIDHIDGDQGKTIVKAMEEYKIENDLDREMTPEEIVAVASDPKSVMHNYFIWDDAEAAHKQRLSTARKLISRVRYVVEASEGHSVRAFVSVKRAPEDKRRYERITRIMSDDEAKKARLRDLSYAVTGLLTQFADVEPQYLKPLKTLREKTAKAGQVGTKEVA